MSLIRRLGCDCNSGVGRNAIELSREMRMCLQSDCLRKGEKVPCAVVDKPTLRVAVK